jgi:hypothetical protein
MLTAASYHVFALCPAERKKDKVVTFSVFLPGALRSEKTILQKSAIIN